ncbi:DUF6503 family protein [uncultured Tenacibaculum sp.]|uniref:DUF6503 family protein n=1 Tax=uncultured Tenacibaculum sp. TaxID=174713 RepID=UPI002619C1E4|nr:DUF6503 family protein [uncultured Tenacibaculum sp.]
MKKLILLSALSLVVMSCKQEAKKEVETQPKQEAKKEDNFPKALGEVFEKHGGIDKWRKAKTMSYKVKKEEHTIDLHTRKTLVQGENFSLGFNGKDVWLSQKDSTAFTSNPKFYYNLYFYFYAMPFVLADDGITYSEVDPIEFEGVKYPGYKISYGSNVGTSPDDNYFIYFNPETKQMEWLGYTVTYFTKEPSEKVSLIRYNDWENVNGFILPKSITWYKKDDKGVPTEPAGNSIEFSSALITQATMADNFFNESFK